MKGRLKQIIALVLITLTTHYVNAQYYKSAFTIPSSPIANDFVSIVDSVYVTSAGIVLYSDSVSKIGNLITIFNCYTDIGSFGFGGYKFDTTGIGNLAVGVYYCTIYSRKYGRATIYDPIIPCDSLPFIDSFKFSFTVSPYPNDIYDIHYTNISVAPNPANNKLIISSALSDIDIAVFDLEGREFNVPHTQNEIDISSLASGVYCLHIRSREGSLVRRFVKE